MPTMILNNANASDNRLIDADTAMIEGVRGTFGRSGVPITIIYTRSFSDLQNVIENVERDTVVFTNCPPDATYKMATVNVVTNSSDQEILSYTAEGYGISKGHIESLCNKNREIVFVVITGAQRDSLGDREIFSLSKHRNIMVKRKSDFFVYGDMSIQAHYEYILRIIVEILYNKSRSSEKSWITFQNTKMTVSEFCAARVLVLSRDEGVGNALGESLTSIFDAAPSPFSCVCIPEVVSAETYMSYNIVDMIIVNGDINYWLSPLSKATKERVRYGVVRLESARKDVSMLPPNTVVYSLDQGRIDVIDLAKFLIDRIEGGKLFGDGVASLCKINNNFLDVVMEDYGKLSMFKALRELTANHDLFFSSLRSCASDFDYFIPVSDSKELAMLLPKAALSAGRSLFTISPLTLDPSNDGKLIEMMDIWFTPDGALATTLDGGLVNVIKNNIELFRSGKIMFYPTPYMCRRRRTKTSILSPVEERILRERPDFRFYHVNDRISDYFTSQTAGMFQTIAAANLPVGRIGRALANLDIPYIANVPSAELNNILDENQESATLFRRRMRGAIEKFCKLSDGLATSDERRKFRLEMEDSVTEYRDGLARFVKTKRRELLGATLLTAATVVAVVLPPEVAGLTKTFIGGGSLLSLGNSYLSYLGQLKDKQNLSPFHIIFKLGGGGRREDHLE